MPKPPSKSQPTPLPTLSPFQAHAQKWAKGCGSDICSRNGTRVVHLRGKIPCDVLFVGEAPGESENALGKPFCGPAGQLLDRIIAAGLHTPEGVAPVTHALCNLVGCIPRDVDGGKAEEPEAECIERCAPRLQELVGLCRPRMVVCVGRLATDWLRPGFKNPVTLPADCKVIDIHHPAYILRANLAQRGMLIQRTVVTIATAVEGL